MLKRIVKWEDITVEEMYRFAEDFGATAIVDGDSKEVIFEWGNNE